MTELRKRSPLDHSVTMSLIAVAAVAVVLSIGALLLFGWDAALGVSVGGLIATSNLWVLAHVIRGVLGEGPHRRLWALAGALKLLALLAGAWFLLRSGLVSGLTLAAGYAALPVGVALASLLAPEPPSLGAPSRLRPPIDPARKRLASPKRTW